MIGPDSLASRVLNLAQRIQQIPAPTFYEHERALFVEGLFRSEQLADVSRDELDNVYARLPGESDRDCLVVSAHLDTVFPATEDLTLTIEPGRISGAGLGDNSLGVAGLLGLLWGLRESSQILRGDLWLVANVGEEGLGNLRGMRAVVDRFADRPVGYVVLEGMALGKIYHQSLGVERFRITCTTPGGHSWVDHGAPSAIHVLAEFCHTLLQMELPKEPRSTLNIGRMRGGTSVNTIAADAELEIDLRSVEAVALATLVANVQTLAARMTRPEVSIAVEPIGQRPAGGIPGDHPLVDLAADVLREVGEEPEIAIGSTDANIPHSRGLPSICIGLTRGGGAHTHNEFVYPELLERGLRQLCVVATRAFALSGRSAVDESPPGPRP
ncbi:MAG: M20/M25/M40 family metallo-hydrolase [Chloroflexi bacterium]|nr:M20/M25/M40 family metallo-hydrolase [Chloroflexota bacterium]